MKYELHKSHSSYILHGPIKLDDIFRRRNIWSRKLHFYLLLASRKLLILSGVRVRDIEYNMYRYKYNISINDSRTHDISYIISY